MEEALCEVAPLRHFASLSLTRGSVPDETPILNFRRLLETHGLDAEILSIINAYLSRHGLLLREGTIVEAVKEVEYIKAAIRAVVEHPFRVIKYQFSYQKARFQGLAKNPARLLTPFAPSNLWMASHRLLSAAGEVRP